MMDRNYIKTDLGREAWDNYVSSGVALSGAIAAYGLFCSRDQRGKADDSLKAAIHYSRAMTSALEAFRLAEHTAENGHGPS